MVEKSNPLCLIVGGSNLNFWEKIPQDPSYFHKTFHTSARVFSCKFAACFQSTFS